MPGVTISAGYGAGGSVVAPAVARQLGMPLLDRAISSEVAARLKVSVTEAEEGATRQSFGGRFLSVLSPLATGVLGAGTDAAADPSALDEAAAFRQQAENVIREAIAGGAVVLGRAGAAALRDVPQVLRIRLYGAPEDRVRQAAQLEQISLGTAEERLRQVDAAREHYVRRLYRTSADDPLLYHLQLDSTAVPLATCVELIALAYRGLIADR